MTQKIKIEKDTVAETLVLPLYGRALQCGELEAGAGRDGGVAERGAGGAL